ncbi:MAG: PEGA domain-containing protein [Planctomycetota bacterium]
MRPSLRTTSRSSIAGLVVLMIALGLSGCVKRLLTVRTEPPGARILVDGEEIGESPCGVPFEYFGTREIIARLEGYETRHELIDIEAPWWQVPPLDFVSEVLDPRDHLLQRDVFLALEPLRSAPEEEARLLLRATELKRRSSAR